MGIGGNDERRDQAERPDAAQAGIDTSAPNREVAAARRAGFALVAPWKDPMSVIEACRPAKRELAGLQIALVGAITGDVPEGRRLVALVHDETADKGDIHVFTNVAGVGSSEVDALPHPELRVQGGVRRRARSRDSWEGIAA